MSDQRPPVPPVPPGAPRATIADRMIGQPAPTPPSPPVNGQATVTVGCKVPNGLIIRAFTYREENESTPTGYRTVRIAVEAARFTLNGPRVTPGGPAGIHENLISSGGFALTTGVPKQLFESWLHDNKNSDVVKNKLIMAFDTENHARDAGKEHASVTSGLEPVDVSGSDNGAAAIKRRIGRGDRLTVTTITKD